ncbi:MAG: type II toxin-antitoxin system RelE/ParE family toxin [Candidatus Binatia bacterium]
MGAFPAPRSAAVLAPQSGGACTLECPYPYGYTWQVYQLQRTDVFDKWLAGLRDAKGKARILARLESVQFGNLGDSRSLGGGLHELRVFSGPGYRVYFASRGQVVIILLCGGDKSSQQRDVFRARRLLDELE